MQDGLVLRDVHRPPAPPLWPPAPGWWLLAVGLAVAGVGLWLWRRARARRQARLLALFDAALASAGTPSERLARSSELLRRAARRHRADADRLDGEAWLVFLDTPRTRFLQGPGRRLLDGPFRPDIDPREAEDAVGIARRRFIELAEAKR